MSSNTENTEAKLAAYIDGQLDPAERAQIEQYLQANPEHRKLLADMIAQRDTLRSLPREKAPADVYDAIQAQLERSVLLDDSAQSATPVIRHSRRSQLFGLAAMLFLAVGLGAVLYFALLPTKPHPVDVATIGSATSQPTTLAANDADLEGYGTASTPTTGGTAVTLAKRRAKTGPALAEGPAAPDQTGVLSNVASPNPALQGLNDSAPQPQQDLSVAVAGKPLLAVRQLSTQPRQLVLLVSTDDPSQVDRQVQSYLDSNHIRWEAVSAPPEQVFYGRAPAPAAAPAVAPAQKTESALLDAAETKTESAPPPAKEQSAAPAPSPSSDVAGADAVAEPARRAAGPTGGVESAAATGSQSPLARLGQQEQQQAQEETSPPAPSETRRAQPSTSSQPTTQPRRATALYSYSAADVAKVTSPRPYIIARGMTPGQAIELTDALSVDRTTQRARLIGQLPAPLPAHKTRHATTRPIPQTQPVAAATLATPTVTVTESLPATTRPSTRPRPTENAELKQSAATTEPSPLTTLAEQTPPPATTAPAATQPTPTLDVVILVESDYAPPATPPAATSQPAPTSQPTPEY